MPDCTQNKDGFNLEPKKTNIMTLASTVKTREL